MVKKTLLYYIIFINIFIISSLDKAVIVPDVGLNMRKLPDVKSEIITLIPNSASVEIIEKSQKQETIDTLTNYWYKVKYINVTGWIFGGYIRISVDSDNKFVLTEKTKYSEFIKIEVFKKYAESSKTFGSFVNVKSIDISNIKLMKIGPMGYEKQQNIPDTDKKEIFFDTNSLFRSFYITNIDNTFNVMELILKDGKGKIYSQKYNKTSLIYIKEKPSIFNNSDSINDNSIYKYPVISSLIKNEACFSPDNWEARVLFDGKEVIKQKVKIALERLSALPKDKIDILKDANLSSSIKKGDNVYIYGYSKNPNTDVTVAIFAVTDEVYEDIYQIYYPFIGVKTKSNDKGQFKVVFKTGKSITKGDYHVYFKDAKGDEYFGGIFGSGRFSIK